MEGAAPPVEEAVAPVDEAAPPVEEAATAEARPAPPQPAEMAQRPISNLLRATGLPNVLAVARRDTAALVLSPIAYIVAAAVVVPTSILGYLLPAFAGEAVAMDGVFSWAAVSMAFLTPPVTMRLLARDRSSGALEQLLGKPMRRWEVVTGKWLAGLAVFLGTMAFTAVFVVLLSIYQRNVDYGAIVAGYLGIVLVGAAWVALGLLASSFTRSQPIAAIAGIVVLLAIQYLSGTAAAFLSPPVGDFFDYASAASRARSFEQGQVVLRDAVYFASLTVGALFLTSRVLGWRRP